MDTISRSALLAALLAVAPLAGAVAQNPNPGNSGGTAGSLIATPTYPRGQDNDPALKSGTVPRDTAGLPADENPRVPGATGNTVVPGDKSTISGDRRGTVEEKTGGQPSDGGGG